MTEQVVEDSVWTIPVNVDGYRILEAFDWLLAHGSFARGERQGVARAKKLWMDPEVLASYHGQKVPFDVGVMSFLSDDARVLFKLTFAA